METFIAQTVQPLLQALILAIIPIVTGYAVKMMKAKTNIAVSDASRAKLEDLACKAVMIVEEKSMEAVKNGSAKWPAYMKNKAAIDKVLQFAPTLEPDRAQMLVDWAVSNFPNIGASNVYKMEAEKNVADCGAIAGGTDKGLEPVL